MMGMGYWEPASWSMLGLPYASHISEVEIRVDDVIDHQRLVLAANMSTNNNDARRPRLVHFLQDPQITS